MTSKQPAAKQPAAPPPPTPADLATAERLLRVLTPPERPVRVIHATPRRAR